MPACRDSRIRRGEVHGGVRLRLHDLRHTAASVAVGQGATLPIIGRLLGHAQAQTTQRYAHVDFDPALLAANAVGNVLKDALKFGVLRESSLRSAPKA